MIVKAEAQILIDEENQKIIILSGDQKISVDSLATLDATDAEVASGDHIPEPTEPETATGIVEQKLDDKVYLQLGTGDELEKAHYRMYQNGLTKYDTLSGYRPDDPLLRQEAAKIIGQAYQILGFPLESKNTACSFSDGEEFDPSLASFIAQSCEWGIFYGSVGNFLPNKTLSKAEALTVLVRILEGKTSSEEVEPRWTYYFIKAKELGLTNETEVMAMDRPVTRYEIALLIYRFKNMILDHTSKAEIASKLEVINNNATLYLDALFLNREGSGETLVNTGILELLSGDTVLDAQQSISILSNSELIEAVQWMNDKGLTSAKTVSNFDPFTQLNREQAAKMFEYFAQSLSFSGIQLSGERNCQFQDLADTPENLKSSIQKVCQLGIMLGSEGKFAPKSLMSKAQFITTLVRIYGQSYLDENIEPRWTNYFLKAKELGILNNQDALTFEHSITRYESALLFYRLWIQKTITDNLNTSKLNNELITTIADSDSSTSTGDVIPNKRKAAIYIDSNLLKNQYFSAGYIELLGKRSQIKKTDITHFSVSEESFVWYGDIIDIMTENKIGSLNFIVSNGYIVDGTIRLLLENKVYRIQPDGSTTAWYQLLEE